MRCISLLVAVAAVAVPAVVSGQTPAPVWPDPPEPPRIRYVGALASEADVGRRESFLGRVRRSLFGGGGTRAIRIERPFDLFVDGADRLYATNGTLRGVVVLDRRSRRGRVLGADVPGGLVRPMGLGGDGRGGVYVADPGARRVVAFGPEGAFRRFYGSAAVLVNPVDVAVDSAGRVYVVDSYLHQVVLFDSAGSLEGVIGRRAVGAAARSEQPAGASGSVGGTRHGGEPRDLWQNRGGEPGEFRFPVAIVFGPEGRLYVSDQLNFRVQVFDRDGRFLQQIGRLGDVPGTFTRPKGVTVDSEGHLYVADAAFNNVQVFGPDGRLLIVFGQLGHGPGEHWQPLGLATGRDDRIYVADRYNNRAQVYQYLPAPAGPAGGARPAGSP